MVVAYNPDKQEVAFLAGGTFRTEERLSLDLTLTFAWDELHSYMAFHNARGTEVSDSAYLGSLRVK